MCFNHLPTFFLIVLGFKIQGDTVIDMRTGGTFESPPRPHNDTVGYQKCFILTSSSYRLCSSDHHEHGSEHGHQHPVKRSSHSSVTVLCYSPLVHSSVTVLWYTPLLQSSGTLLSGTVHGVLVLCYSPLVHSSVKVLWYTPLLQSTVFWSSVTVLRYTPLLQSSMLQSTAFWSSATVLWYTPLWYNPRCSSPL